VIALAIGLGRLSDNSFFTHVATGRLILDLGHVPTADPYSFTAHGADWVVQSWLASTIYGLIDEAWGGAGLQLLNGALTAGVFAVAWRLSRPAQGLLVRLAIGGLVVAIGAGQWAERPLLFGLLALGLTVLAAEGGVDPRWLVPIGWLWVNSHGSFPVGVAYVVVVAVGRRLDHEPAGVELRCLRWLGLGVLAGAVNPLGPRILLFPVELLQRQDVLRHVIEWQSPGFQTISERLFLIQLMVAVLALVRRPTYRDGMVVAVFLAAALVGSRNIAVTSLVLVPVLARAWSDVGSIRSDAHARIARVGFVAAALLFAVLLVGRIGGPHYDFAQYPVASLDYLDARHVDLTEVRMGTPEMVGNLLELRDGAVGEVFFDDRFDMYPDEVADDVIVVLGAGRPGATRVLDRWDLDLVLWSRSGPLSQILREDPDWRVLKGEADWVLFCREGAPLGPDLPRC